MGDLSFLDSYFEGQIQGANTIDGDALFIAPLIVVEDELEVSGGVFTAVNP